MQSKKRLKNTLWALSVVAGLLGACATDTTDDAALEHPLTDFLIEEGHVPLTTWANGIGHIGVDVKTSSGEAYRFVVDMGASVNVIDQDAAASLGLAGIQSIADVNVGGFAVASLQLVVFDLGSVNQALIAAGTDPIDGVLGASFLSSFRGVIDYRSGALYLSDVETSEIFVSEIREILSGQRYQAVSLQRNPVSFLELDVMINGAGPRNFIIDTGAVAATLNLQTAQDLGLEVEASATPAITVGGALAAFQTHVEQLDVGQVATGEHQLAVIDLSGFNNQLAQVGARPMDGLVGADFLAEHEAVIDYTGLQLFLHDATSSVNP